MGGFESWFGKGSENWVVGQFERFVIPKRSFIARGICFCPAHSRFLTGKERRFGMTRCNIAQIAHSGESKRLLKRNSSLYRKSRWSMSKQPNVVKPTATPSSEKTLNKLFDERDSTRPGSREEKQAVEKILQAIFR